MMRDDDVDFLGRVFDFLVIVGALLAFATPFVVMWVLFSFE